ncbi:MAG: sialidase family protein [Victivallaceae bacterium]
MIRQIKNSAFWVGRKTPQYFHPSVCLCNDGLLMTLQTFEGRSDVFGPVMWSLSRDAGKSWSEPQPIPALGHNIFSARTIEGIADVRTVFHPDRGAVIAIGCNTYYVDGACHQNLPQFPIYAVRRANGSWSKRKKLEAVFFKDCLNWRAACAQMLVLPDNKVLIPLYFSRENGKNLFSVCSVKCGFDGEDLTVENIGNVLSLEVNRGLIEPSLAVLNDKYYMTVRAEDDHGYLAVSDDGLNWGELVPWHWDDGETLVMSSTQQHWAGNGRKLFLVYTRSAGFNDDVMRWRAPLFIARFDEKGICLVRDTEQEVMPLIRTGGHPNSLGNFHIVDITPATSIVSAGSLTRNIGQNGVMDFFSDTLLAEIQWN